MKTLRRTLQLTVLLAAYVAALAIYAIPYGWAGAAAVLALTFSRKSYRYFAYGTARWADANTDIPHMIDWSSQ
jgi:hypothetical protein